MLPILSGNVASALGGAYEVANSCRFNDDDSAELTKTFGSAGNQKTWTFSFWVKRGLISGSTTFSILEAGHGSTPWFVFTFNNDAINVAATAGSSASWATTSLFRDPSAWYHVVLAVDTTSSTSSISNGSTDRIRVFVNNVQQTLSGGSVPSQDADLQWNGTAGQHMFGASYGQFMDAYVSEVAFIDGSALNPSSFGEYDNDSPTIWKPKDLSDLTFGTNGYWLDFEDSSALGNDVSGNNNDWTTANLAATDQATDTPTNNFCTINPLVVRIGRTAPTLSEGNLKCVHSDSGGNTPAWGTFLLTAGKWYWEVKVSVGNYSYIGIWQPEYNNGLMDDALNGIVIYRQDGNKQAETAATATSYGDSYTGGSDIVSVAVNCDTGTIWFAKNGTWQNSATEAEIEAGTTTNAAYTGKSFSKGIIPSISAYSGATHEYNFGSPPYSISSPQSDANGFGSFSYAPPSNYLSLCSKNLGSDGG